VHRMSNSLAARTSAVDTSVVEAPQAVALYSDFLLKPPPGLSLREQDRHSLVNDCDAWDSEISTAASSDCEGEDLIPRSISTLSSELNFPNHGLPHFRPPPGLEHPDEQVAKLMTANGYVPGNAFRRIVSSSDDNGDSSEPNGSGTILNLEGRLGDAPDLGTLGCPSVGSAGHYLGLCKPCDFVNRGSCRIGIECKFCHLCCLDANKQRKKDRKKQVNLVRRFQQGIAIQQGRHSPA